MSTPDRPTHLTLGELTPVWREMLRRALREQPSHREIDRERLGYVETTALDVGSLSRPGEEHRVVVLADAAGVHVSCTCERFSFGSNPCHHMTTGLVATGHLSAADLAVAPGRLKELYADD